MTYEDFVKNITAPLTAVDYNIRNAQSMQECDYLNNLRRELKHTIVRTMIAVLQEREHAESYLKELTAITQEYRTDIISHSIVQCSK